MQCVGFWGALVSEAGDVWDWGLWRFWGAQRGSEIGTVAILGTQRGSEIGKWETGRITVKKQEIS